MRTPESDRFDTKHPELCPSLRWKGQFILAANQGDKGCTAICKGDEAPEISR